MAEIPGSMSFQPYTTITSFLSTTPRICASEDEMCEHTGRSGRRSFLTGIAAAAATAVAATGVQEAKAANAPYADPTNPALPDPGMTLDLQRVALVVIDPQIDFMSPKSAAWPILGESVTEQNLVPNLVRLFEAAKRSGITVA